MESSDHCARLARHDVLGRRGNLGEFLVVLRGLRPVRRGPATRRPTDRRRGNERDDSTDDDQPAVLQRHVRQRMPSTGLVLAAATSEPHGTEATESRRERRRGGWNACCDARGRPSDARRH